MNEAEGSNKGRQTSIVIRKTENNGRCFPRRAAVRVIMYAGLSRGQTTYHLSEAGQGRLLGVTSSVSSDSEMLGLLVHKGERKDDGSPPPPWNSSEAAASAADSPTPLLRLPPTRAHPAPFQYQHLHVQNASRHWPHTSGHLPLQSLQTLIAPAPTPQRREDTTLPPLAA